MSDVHLGTPGSQAYYPLDFLRVHDAEGLYLVDDILDCSSISTGRCAADDGERRAAGGRGVAEKATAPAVSFSQELFRFSTLLPEDLMLRLAGGFVSIPWFESSKLFKKKWWA